MSTQEPPQNENKYFIDHESGGEMARLLDHDRHITKGMGGLLSERSNDFSGLHRVLDLGCGPGGWVQEVAFANPKIEVVGVDISQQMISYAQMQSKVQGLTNTEFRVMDIQQPLDFPDDYFDLVNARQIAFLSPAVWPSFLQECMRITKSGGTIRLTETEGNISNSPADEKMGLMFFQALRRIGQSFSPTGQHLGISPMLPQLLREVGCQNVQIRAHVIDFSAGTEAHASFYKDLQAFFKLMQPFLVQVGVASQEEVNQVYEQMLVDLMQDNFRGVHLLFTAWGQKP